MRQTLRAYQTLQVNCTFSDSDKIISLASLFKLVTEAGLKLKDRQYKNPLHGMIIVN